ncbi:peptidoglycan DD-metalloendopeptidase family protein [Niveibacterium sp. 24ML]|uniref:peptidoglycan DD-metalloendopeptidase family protein n=1 Tax=Niveibacterium sp. 24ML TaxID=2985512 RepID=UPI00226F33FD|nr:peptidoglycan DD-metalloendopeptidase family protein [Niveibacterium sp. 24ML]MCX9156055.1 peptidoglycan DD-metalloendopeptidase family protein [Niveibacterium sp. 24ML]
MTLNLPLNRLLLCAVLAVALSACTSTGRAPVEDRAATGRSASAATSDTAAPQAPKPGYYVVKRGDTLISIALEHGQDWRDIASWNGIENPNLILVGQELKVKQGDGAVAKVPASPVIETKPLEPKGTAATVVPQKPEEGLRREPKGGKVPYSDQALAAAVKADEAARSGAKLAVTPSPLPAASASEPVPADSPKKESAPDPKSATPDPKGSDDFDWAWPASGKVVNAFNESTNKGVDIGGQVGDPVVASAPGKVVYVGSGLRGYGNLVIIKHNATYLSAYAHNQKILVKEGQAVKRGQEIAALGDSDADRAKLHFEIRRQGKPVDPLKYLPKR